MKRVENTELDGGTARKKCKSFSGEMKRKSSRFFGGGMEKIEN